MIVLDYVRFHASDVGRWLMRLAAAYHQYRGLKEATPKQLDDMGISRKSANRAFYRQFADKKID